MKKINCILLVDDNEADNEYHKIIIDESGVCNQIRVAEDGVMALEYIKNSANPDLELEYPKPDLIFLDINMPRLNGFEFLKEYNKLDRKPIATFVMLTTSLNPDDQKKAESFKEVQGFDHKPLTVEMLHKILQKFF